MSLYSKDLEQQVRDRTREVAGFMEYTPALIYMKDAEGRYLLVNSRHEQLFGTRNQAIRGRTVFEVYPEEMAAQFRRNDLKVLQYRRPYQAEETVTVQGEERVFLSVRFPIIARTARSAVCAAYPWT